jgi:hypothetical protein
MLDYIEDFTALLNEAKSIDDYLNITCSEEPAEMVQRGNDLAVYMARTGKMLADAKYHQEAKTQSAIMEELKKSGALANIPATVMNNLLKSVCKEENYLVNWIERLNRACVHQMEFLRTTISLAKEMRRN